MSSVIDTPTLSAGVASGTEDSAITLPINLAGVPGLVVPCGFSENLPVGLQLLSPAFDEERMFRIARMYEAATDWHTKRPKL